MAVNGWLKIIELGNKSMHKIYTPDTWVIVKITVGEDGVPLYKVFGQWYGGFAGADSWKLNSGIVGVKFVDNYYIFEGYSGSFYHCHKNTYSTTMYGHSVLHNLKKSAENSDCSFDILEDGDWTAIDYDRGI
jgi:hypothetical protein